MCSIGTLNSMSLPSSYKDELLFPHFVIIVPNLIVDIVVLNKITVDLWTITEVG